LKEFKFSQMRITILESCNILANHSIEMALNHIYFITLNENDINCRLKLLRFPIHAKVLFFISCMLYPSLKNRLHEMQVANVPQAV